MKLLTIATALALAVFVAPARAADKPGLFLVVDDAQLFSTDAKRQAEKRLAGTKFDGGLNFNLTTVKEMPAEWKKKYDEAGDKERIVREWAKAIATKDKAKGPFVLICMSPGRTLVLADEETVKRGFGKTAEGAVVKMFDTALKEAAKLDGDERTKHRDAALLKAADYVVGELKGTKVKPSKE